MTVARDAGADAAGAALRRRRPSAPPRRLPRATASRSGAAAVAAVVAIATPTREAPFERKLPAPLRRVGLLDLRLWQWIALPVLLARRLRAGRGRDRAGARACCARRSRAPRPRSTTTLLRARRAARSCSRSPSCSSRRGLPVLALAEPVARLPARAAQGPGRGRAVLGRAAPDRRLRATGSSRPPRARGPPARSPRSFRWAAAPPRSSSARSRSWCCCRTSASTSPASSPGSAWAASRSRWRRRRRSRTSSAASASSPTSRCASATSAASATARTGVVEEIGLRSTRIRTPERTLVTIPNADFAQRELENLAARDRIRLYAVLGLRYETTPRSAPRRARGLSPAASASHPLVSRRPLRIYFIGFGTTSLDVEVSAYVAHHRPRRVLGGARGPLPAHDRHHRWQCGTALARPVQRCRRSAPRPRARAPAATSRSAAELALDLLGFELEAVAAGAVRPEVAARRVAPRVGEARLKVAQSR